MKITKPLSCTFIALCWLIFSSDVYAQKKKKDKELDGKVFLVELSEEGGKVGKSISEELTFKSDKFKAKVMAEKNKFDPAAYTVSVDSSSGERIISFEAESKNDGGELLNWKGTINNEDAEGKAVWTKKGKVKKEYSFSGNLKIKK